MAFSELPIVDDNIKASEDSVLAVRNMFSQKNGFISREEHPDYGCDLDIELIINENEASSKKFPVQIKSSSDIQIIKVDEIEYLTKPFKTSRLFYLCQRAPAYGLIIIYDEKKRICYYDYVEAIVKRVTIERNDTNWSEQESVNIHIAKSNVVNAESIKLIHERFVNRFQAQAILIKRHGEQFEIPSFNFNSDSFDTQDIANLPVAEILKKYGLLFINSSQILTLYKLLGQISLNDILHSKELIFIASIVYGEMGKCMEADLFLTKAFQLKEQFEDHEIEILQFIRIKVDFLLGRRNKQAFFDDLQNMAAVAKNKFNALQLKINLLYYIILKQIEENEFVQELENNILEVFTAIEQADIEAEKKMFLKVFHAENLHMYISSRMLKWTTNLRVKESLKVHVSQEERNWMFTKTNSLIYTATLQVLDARDYSLKEKNKLLQAHSEYALARFFLIKEFDFLLLSFKYENFEKEKNFRRSFLFAIQSHNLFFELGLLRDARLALICAYDLHTLARLYHNLDISSQIVSEETMINNLRFSEKEMGLKEPYISIVEKAHEDYVMSLQDDGDESLAVMTDEQIEKFTLTILQEYQLPLDRHVNLINEVKSLRFFAANGNKADYEVLTDLRHYQSKSTHYAMPSSYIIKSKRSGMESLPSNNLQKLATEFGALK